MTTASDEANPDLEEEQSGVLTPANAAKLGGLVIRKATAAKDTGGSFWTFYGQGGSGKTTLAGSCADCELGYPYMHVDIDGGIEAISHKSNVEYVAVTSYKQFDKFTAEIEKANHGYKTICVDNLSELADLCILGIAGMTDQPEIQEWGQMTREIVHKVRQWKNIARAQGMNIIFCAWDADEKDDRGVLKKELALTPKLREKFPGIVTTIGHIDVLNDPNMRTLNFAPSPKSVSKFRRAADANSVQIPFKITYGLSNLPMPDILKVVKGGGKWPDKYKVSNSASE